MDVTRRADIDRTVDTIIREAGRMDAVVHFAGMGLRGFFEDLSMQEIRRLYDVNVFGIMELTQAVLPHMRARRSGRIVITASAAGRMGEMSIAGYSSGKFAVVGLGECLRQEMALLNIHVSVLEPGLIYTPHFGVNRNRARRAQDPASPYYFWFCQHEAIVDGLLAANKFTAEDIAQVVHKILTARHPRLHYMVGFKFKLMLALRNIIPFEWYERIHEKSSSAWSPVRAIRPPASAAWTPASANAPSPTMAESRSMIDLHTHTDRSDGTASPAQLVDDAKAMGLQALGITDHDTLDGYDIAAPLAAAAGLELVCGIELSTRPDPPPDGSRPPSVHLLGYFLQAPASAGIPAVDSRATRRAAASATASSSPS
jgi:NAD(P)-dependent dehydrogenase (short-subunit alcohol dehydrogenase family)